MVSNSEKIVVVADLHIGFELELSKRGIGIPSQAPRLKRNLLSMIKRESPDRLLILGDVKHSVPEIPLQEWEMIPELFEELCSSVPRVSIIPGNHDGDIESLLPYSIELLPARGIRIGEVAFLHGHAWPSADLLSADYLVIGHNHPTIRLVDRSGFRMIEPVWLLLKIDGSRLAREFLRYHGITAKENPRAVVSERFRVDVGDPTLVVMPSFNDMLGGVLVNVTRPEHMLGPLLDSKIVDINQAEAYLVDGTLLGNVKQLRDLANT